ncbi:MAG TPA: haloacid dehalogenase type II [Steroidobacteraceae bacterium]|jgi:2-haloacid dehalogenase|nr:haloacid dehalogenase type II [Steroidobacteraceae bacterium]
MTLDRRTFVTLGAATLMTSLSARAIGREDSPWGRIRAVAFDAFTLFDPRPVFQACESAAPGHGAQLADAWRTRLFEYQWLRALAGQYEDFGTCARGALEFAARSLKIDLPKNARDALMQGWLELRAWPDVAPALAELKHSGKRLALLSNATAAMLNAGLKNSGLEAAFDQVISTGRVRSFKPDPNAYRLGTDLLQLGKGEILFVAFAGWDVAGAKWFGYPTFWNNRQNAAAEGLEVEPDGAGATLNDVAQFLAARRTL